MIDRLYVSKTIGIFKLRKKENFVVETEYDMLDVDISYKNRRKRRIKLYLGEVYRSKPSYSLNETHVYTRAFRQFVQFLIYVTAEQGPYSIWYDRFIRRKEHIQNDYEIFEFIGLE